MNIGLIAGGGQFPLLFSKKAAKKGYRVFAVGFKSETDPQLSDTVEELRWLYVGQISKLIHYFKEHDITQAVMLGSMNKVKIFKDIRPDLKALAFIAKNIITHDDTVLRALSDLFLKHDIQIMPSTFLLPELISPQGVWTRRKPDKAENKDIVCGWKIARRIGDLDIGQCVVVSNGTIMAVEAIDGTDATILRGGKLAGKNNAVVVKLCKPGQDLRFDLPSCGVQTIENMQASGAKVLAIEAQKSVSFDREEMIVLADTYNISIIALTDDEINEFSC